MPTPTTTPADPRPTRSRWILLLTVFVLMDLLVFAGFFAWQQFKAPARPVSTWTSQGVLQKIQQLNNLESAVFHIESVVTSSKEGNWYALWQDQQKGLFVAKGSVVAGINLSQLKASDIQWTEATRQVVIHLPPVQILGVHLDDLHTYDIQTGFNGLLKLDPTILNEAQTAAKGQIRRSACQSGILNFANDSAQQQISRLFTLVPDLTVSVIPAKVPACH